MIERLRTMVVMMENEPIFRGKSLIWGVWLHGFYIKINNAKKLLPDKHCIIPHGTIESQTVYTEDKHEVDPDTVSQGFYIDDKCYFCGDIIEFESGTRCVIVWKNDSFMLKSIKTFYGMHDYMTSLQLRLVSRFKLLGNVFDNPELMEVDE